MRHLLDNDNQPQDTSQGLNFFWAIFGQRATGFLEIRALSEPLQPRQFFFSIPSELGKAALAVSLRNQADYFGPRNQQSQQQLFSTEVPSLLNTSTGSLLGIRGAPCRVDGG